MALQLSEFISRLEGSGLLTSDEIGLFLDSYAPDKKPQDGQQLAQQLVRENKLTAYQAQAVYQGKGRKLVLGNYFILDKLGQGGMGVVFKAEHRRMERIVALKVLAPKVAKSPDLLHRFQREVKAAAKLSHPNIVRAYDADEAKGTHYLVMEYVEGADLSSRVKSEGPLAEPEAISCILQAAQGLDYAHRQGIIHRDIKPANLLLDTDGTVKILDMGLARIGVDNDALSDLTGTGALMGTIDYMAPEQAVSAKHADERADVYSLGMALWYLLTGMPAYTGDSPMAKLLAHRESQIPCLSESDAGATDALNIIFQRMVAKSVEDRYQTMGEVIVDLEAITQETTCGSSVNIASAEENTIGEFGVNPDSIRPLDSVPPVVMQPPQMARGESPAAAWTESGDTATVHQPLTTPLTGPGNASRKMQRRSRPMPWWNQWPLQIAAGAAVLLLVGVAWTVHMAMEKDQLPDTNAPLEKMAARRHARGLPAGIQPGEQRQVGSTASSDTTTELAPPTLVAPLPDAVLPNGNRQGRRLYVWQFEWSSVPGADRYHLQVFGHLATIPTIDYPHLAGTTYRSETGGYVADHNLRNWYWRVRAMTASGWTEWSEQRIFHVEPLAWGADE